MTLLEEIMKHGPYGSRSGQDGQARSIEPGWMSARDWPVKGAIFPGDRPTRDIFVKNYAWAIPDEGALKEIKEFVKTDKILEIGSGLGLWAKLLQDLGVNITPTNHVLEKDSYLNLIKGPFMKIHGMNHKEALEAFGLGHDVLMLCWPPYKGKMAYEALEGFKGDKLIYIGESAGGCTAEYDFFSLIDREWEEVKCIVIPQWLGIHDSLFLYKRL